MKAISGRIAFDIILLAATGFLLWQSMQLPQARGASSIGPSGFPTAICGFAIITLLAVLAGDIRTMRADTGSTGMKLRQIGAVALLIGLLAAYIALLQTLGFLASTTGFLFLSILAAAWALKPPGTAFALPRTALTAAIISIAGTASTYLAFSKGFGLIFP